MADTQTTVALNIGSQRISVAVFESSKNGSLILKGYESETILADPAFEASRESQIRVALEDIIGRLDIAKSKVRYVISGQTVFMRFVKLPPLQDDNIEQLVTFEAQQHIPFPINEVVWDYELIQGGGETEAVIVAIKKEILEEINDTVNQTGLTTAEVDVAPMALYNSFLAAYGTPSESILIIDMGAKTTNLLYVEGGKFFTRSVAIGGASITSAIAKEYDVSFPEAENQKIVNGMVALGGGHTETLDESVAALAMVIRNALTRLPAQVAQTTNYFRSQHGGSPPTKVLLAGGGANLPYTLEFFKEKLNLPIEFFNPLNHLSVAENVDADKVHREAHMMGELVGLGLRGVGKSAINIDLVPEVVEKIRAADRRKPFLIGAAAILILGFSVYAVLKNVAASKAEDELRTMVEVQEELAPYERQIKSLLKKEEELREVANAYTQVETDHAFWFELLGELRGSFSSDAVWLTKMTPLYGYNPLTEGEETNIPTQEVVSGSFTGTQGEAASAIAAPPKEAVEEKPKKKSKKNAKKVASPVPQANAIRITGFWRENPRSQNVVSDLLKNLRTNSKVFTFSMPGPRGESVTLSDEQILKISVTGAEGDLGFPFELTLPLASPLAVK